MSATYTMRKLAEESPKCMADDVDEAATELGHEIADELDMEDVSDCAAKRLGKAAWGLAEGRLSASYVRSRVLRRGFTVREECCE